MLLLMHVNLALNLLLSRRSIDTELLLGNIENILNKNKSTQFIIFLFSSLANGHKSRERKKSMKIKRNKKLCNSEMSWKSNWWQYKNIFKNASHWFFYEVRFFFAASQYKFITATIVCPPHPPSRCWDLQACVELLELCKS